jgi:prepilin-type processing-associated H-X9-DG protein
MFDAMHPGGANVVMADGRFVTCPRALRPGFSAASRREPVASRELATPLEKADSMRRVPMFVLALVGFAGMLGCGGSALKPYPVRGQVTFRKKPLAEAVVTFHPKPGQPPGYPLSATTDAEAVSNSPPRPSTTGARALR